jgi:hypothetical protein
MIALRRLDGDNLMMPNVWRESMSDAIQREWTQFRVNEGPLRQNKSDHDTQPKKSPKTLPRIPVMTSSAETERFLD